MKTIELNEMDRILDAAPMDMATLFLGDTGVGKTQKIKQYCKERGMTLKVLILSQIEASECLGIPIQTKREFNGKEYNTIEQALPSWVFELAQAKNPVLYLDEFLCAEPAVMNSFLNFLSEKEVNGIDLHHVKIIAASNIGNYTFEPDNNILSRFCMFYVENNSFSKYLNEKYRNNKNNIIFNDYKDETERKSNIFEPRSLKPRCHEQLLQVKDPELLSMFYEGFTNKPMTPRFHTLDVVCNIVSGFATKDESGRYSLGEDKLNTVAGLIHKQYPRLKSYDRVCSLTNITYNKQKLVNLCEDLKENYK